MDKDELLEWMFHEADLDQLASRLRRIDLDTLIVMVAATISHSDYEDHAAIHADYLTTVLDNERLEQEARDES